MLGQLWVVEEDPGVGVVDELPVDPLDVDPVEAAVVEAFAVCPVVDADDVVLAVAAEIPRPRLNPRALAAIPAATNGRFSFMCCPPARARVAHCQ